MLGATSAEASGGGGSGEHVAGHALALLMPTIALMAGLDRGASNHTVGGKRAAAPAAALHEARYRAVFTNSVLATLPAAEAEKLKSGNVDDWEAAARLQPLAVEGTTPASPVLYIPDPSRRYAAQRDAESDKRAFALAAPNVGRSFKVLHVGGSKVSEPHAFYHDFVEWSVHGSHPLYTDAKVRELGAAASQFVFTRTGSHDITQAGATPSQLVLNDYALVPLHVIDTEKGKILDFAADASRADVIPPRAGTTVLTPAQSQAVRTSVAHLKALDESLSKDDAVGHCVLFEFSYSTLVNNPEAVKHFCERVNKVAVAGIVDFRVVNDLAVHPGEAGEDAGHFCVVNVVMP